MAEVVFLCGSNGLGLMSSEVLSCETHLTVYFMCLDSQFSAVEGQLEVAPEKGNLLAP